MGFRKQFCIVVYLRVSGVEGRRRSNGQHDVRSSEVHKGYKKSFLRKNTSQARVQELIISKHEIVRLCSQQAAGW